MALSNELVHSFDKNEKKSFPLSAFIGMIIVAIAFGTGVGFMLSHQKKISPSTTASSSKDSTENTPNTAGIADKTTFKDIAEGTLKEGGIEGEGSFHLVRPGGESQNVYLSSSTVDMTKYIDKKIKVHGQTLSGQKAGWLMDVGFVELLQ